MLFSGSYCEWKDVLQTEHTYFVNKYLLCVELLWINLIIYKDLSRICQAIGRVRVSKTIFYEYFFNVCENMRWSYFPSSEILIGSACWASRVSLG